MRYLCSKEHIAIAVVLHLQTLTPHVVKVLEFGSVESTGCVYPSVVNADVIPDLLLVLLEVDRKTRQGALPEMPFLSLPEYRTQLHRPVQIHPDHEMLGVTQVPSWRNWLFQSPPTASDLQNDAVAYLSVDESLGKSLKTVVQSSKGAALQSDHRCSVYRPGTKEVLDLGGPQRGITRG
jgi:hypothetical protein